MKYTISKRHVFVAKEPVKMYFVNDMPFAFDALENHQKQDKWILTAVSYTHLTLPTK